MPVSIGIGDGAVYLQHTVTGAPIVLEGVDTLVLCAGHTPVDDLVAVLEGWSGQVVSVGDCLSPRTAEEAIYEGFRAGIAI